MIEIPVDPGAYVASVVAVAFFAMLLTEWLKRYIHVDLLVNVLTLLLSWGVSFAADGVLSGWLFAGPELFTSWMTGFFGATIAVFGYEVIKNAYDLIGHITEMFRPKL